jgi:predicted metal-binding membrane protein
MTGTALERLLGRDRAIVSTALAVITALAWLYILRLAADMDMGGMRMDGVRMASTGLRMVMTVAREPWSAAEFLLMFVMWAVMMVGMMTPSVAPLVLLYARVGRRAALDEKPFASTAWFAGGYLFAWTLFALAATAAQWALERVSLLTPEMASASVILGGIVLVAAGLYQWMPWKDVCLTHCRSPIAFLQHHGGFRRDAPGAFRLGAKHGLYCLGCCWALMTLLFVGGIMNVTWIAAIAVLVLIEKVTPAGRAIGRVGGLALLAAGVWLFVGQVM